MGPFSGKRKRSWCNGSGGETKCKLSWAYGLVPIDCAELGDAAAGEAQSMAIDSGKSSEAPDLALVHVVLPSLSESADFCNTRPGVEEALHGRGGPLAHAELWLGKTVDFTSGGSTWGAAGCVVGSE
jgi:hypothetical protein